MSAIITTHGGVLPAPFELDANLRKFLSNTQELADRLKRDSSLVALIREKAPALNDTKRNRYCTLIPNELGLKTRAEVQAKVEIAATADLYIPGLNISSFALPIGPYNRRYLLYLTQDFSGIKEEPTGFDPKNPLVKDMITHFLRKGYGFAEGTELSDPTEEDVSRAITNMANMWQLLLRYENPSKFAVIDLDYAATIRNYREVYDGVDTGTGRFGRLKYTWEQISNIGKDEIIPSK